VHDLDMEQVRDGEVNGRVCLCEVGIAGGGSAHVTPVADSLGSGQFGHVVVVMW
jgi:hypothetical protein